MTDTSLSFMRSLCLGEIEQDILFPFPTLAAAQRELLNEVLGSVDRLLTGQADAFRKWDQAGEIPPRFIEKMKEFGLFGLIIPESHGGMGFGNMAYARTLQQIARHDASLAVTVGAHSSIGMRGLKLFGTPEQKARYYEKLATGEMIAAFCLTESGGGLGCRVHPHHGEEDHDDGFLLNGSKIWITNGGIADFFTVFAKTGETEGGPPVGLHRHPRHAGRDHQRPRRQDGHPRQLDLTTVYFEDVRVPGEPAGAEGRWLQGRHEHPQQRAQRAWAAARSAHDEASHRLSPRSRPPSASSSASPSPSSASSSRRSATWSSTATPRSPR
jgi:acyl-CoA dehydrogenase family protein 9